MRFFELFLTSVRGFEPPAYRLGGGRSILLSYTDKGIFMGVYALKNRYHFLCLRRALSNSGPGAFCPKSNKSIITLGGGRSILLSYADKSSEDRCYHSAETRVWQAAFSLMHDFAGRFPRSFYARRLLFLFFPARMCYS